MLRILHLEDSDTDALLIEEMVRQEGIVAEFIRAKTSSQFSKALEENEVHVVLADSALPGFEGASALKMVRQKYPGISFICLSGSSDPAKIKSSFDLGATDYIAKDDLPRLMKALRIEAKQIM